MLYLANAANPMVWIAVAIIVLVIFGGQKIPELMKGMGSGMREFKKGLKEFLKFHPMSIAPGEYGQ